MSTSPLVNTTAEARVTAYIREHLTAVSTSAVRLTPRHGQTTTIWVVFVDGVQTHIVREITSREWVQREPSVLSQEPLALKMLAGSGIPVPRLLAHDTNASIQGLALTLMTSLPGQVHDTSTPPSHAKLAAAARMLVQVHEQPIDTRHGAWPRFRPHYFNQATRIFVPTWAQNPDAWRDAIELFRTECDATERLDDVVTLHRDYHFGNLLWQGDRISAVLDWISSCAGPRAVDVAHCRWNLCRFHGHESCDIFTEAYGLPVPHLERMDVVACVGGLPDLRDLTWDQSARIESFLMRSLANC